MSEIGEMTERLREIAARLRDPDVPDSEAEELAREAADLVARAGGELERAARRLDPDADVR